MTIAVSNMGYLFHQITVFMVQTRAISFDFAGNTIQIGLMIISFFFTKWILGQEKKRGQKNSDPDPKHSLLKANIFVAYSIIKILLCDLASVFFFLSVTKHSVSYGGCLGSALSLAPLS